MSGESIPHSDRSVLIERTTILPVSGWSLPDLRELWRYRDLLFLLTLRNMAIIYRQSILGIPGMVRPKLDWRHSLTDSGQ